MCPKRVFGARNLEPELGPTLAVIGNFDGVHAGHRAVIRHSLELAASRKLAPLVLTFDPHPSQVLGRGSLPALTRLDRKLELLCRLDPALTVVVEPFTLELARTPAARFVERLLVEELKASVVLVGENFRFGQGREGDLSLLVRLGEAFGFEARAEPLTGDAEGPYSSTRARRALAAGDLGEVERQLGRPHAVTGLVVRGDGRGRSIGVPTANLANIVEALPPHGVFAALVDRRVGSQFEIIGQAVVNYGVRPTVMAGPSFEAHLLDYEGDLYGQELRLHLVTRLREERKFGGLAELVAQIARDIEAARAALSGRKPDESAEGAWY